ncbi:MAG: LysM peptidoglycan-binding domain-containing protein [Bacteroidota bacterium]|nr:LysM peptidoglycan-binding domain-containing protein [Bacteroidota bacterium]
MKRTFILIFLLFLFLMTGNNLQAQTVKQSGTIEKYSYQTHTIVSGESLSLIAKRYNVSVDELNALNPALKNGFKTGMVIRIPVKTSKQSVLKTTIHQAVSGESTYSIAKKYGISSYELIKANPELAGGLKSGMILIIPGKKQVQTGAKQSLANPALKTKETLVTPSGSAKLKQTAPVPAEKSKQPLTAYPNVKPSYSDPNAIHVGIFLPFYLNQNEKVSQPPLKKSADNSAESLKKSKGDKTQAKQIVERKDSKLNSRSINFLHFYEGLILAADSFAQAGLKLELSVFDTQGDANIASTLLKNEDFSKLDLIIGPVYDEEQVHFSAFSQQHKIPIVSPLSSSTPTLETNPYLFQINPDKDFILEQTGDCIVGNSKGNNVIVLLTPGYQKNDEHQLQAYCHSKLYGSRNYHEFIIGKKNDALRKLISLDRENIFVIPSTNEAIVNRMISAITPLAETYPVTSWGMPSIAKFTSIPVRTLHSLRLNYLSPYFVDRKSDEVKNFIALYESTYHTAPNQYSYQGYDIGCYFFEALKRNGKDFYKHIRNFKTSLLQSDYQFKQVKHGGGFMNKSLFNLEYGPDSEIEKKEIF